MRVTPEMEVDKADHVRSLEEIVNLLKAMLNSMRISVCRVDQKFSKKKAKIFL